MVTNRHEHEDPPSFTPDSHARLPEKRDHRKRVVITSRIWIQNEKGIFVRKSPLDYLRDGKDMVFLCGLPTTGKSTIAQAMMNQAPYELTPKYGCKEIGFYHLTMEQVIVNWAKATNRTPFYWTSDLEKWGSVNNIFRDNLVGYYEEKQKQLEKGIDLRAIVEVVGIPAALTELGQIQDEPIPGTDVMQQVEQIGLDVYRDSTWWTPPKRRYEQKGIETNPAHAAYCFSAIREFLSAEYSEKIDFMILGGAPNLVNAKIGIVVREAIYGGDRDLGHLATQVPLAIDETRKDGFIDGVFSSAPPDIVLHALYQGGRMAQAADSLYSGVIPSFKLPKWTEGRYSEDESLLFKPHYLSYMTHMVQYLNYVYRHLLSLSPDNATVFLNRPVDPKRQVLVV